MKVIALISEASNTLSIQWQFDKVMAAIAYDVQISIVFLFDGIAQLQNNQMWKCLELYGIEDVFLHSDNNQDKIGSLINYTKINDDYLYQLIQQSDLVI